MIKIDSITEFHRMRGLPDPVHPLISLFRVEDLRFTNDPVWKEYALNFYCVSLKRGITSKVKYGRQYYDFDKGLMTFLAAGQQQTLEIPEGGLPDGAVGVGKALLFHPDLLHGHQLAATIKNYGFFSYAVYEALHLSDQEESYIAEIFNKIGQEIQHIDKHTQQIVLSHIDLLLNYSDRFYDRQFITRKAVNNDLLRKMDDLLDKYLSDATALKNGPPTVEFLAAQLNLSAHYLSDMLRSLTGMGAQQHIHEKMITKAKAFLSTTNLSVAEIAYRLGFEYPQSFNKLFKKKTDKSPLAFRRSLN